MVSIYSTFSRQSITIIIPVLLLWLRIRLQIYSFFLIISFFSVSFFFDEVPHGNFGHAFNMIIVMRKTQKDGVP